MQESVARFCAWAKTRNVACMFARAMFSLPDQYGITFGKVDGLYGKELAPAVAAEIRRHIDAKESEGAVIFLDPKLNPTELEILFDSIGAIDGWTLRSVTVQHKGDSYRVTGLDCYIGQDQGVPVLSEIVAFAPFAYLPISRQAPLPALSLRTKPQQSGNPLEGRHERRANLAAIKFDIPQASFDLMWKRSQELRKEIDGADNPLARARVALAFPITAP